MTDNELLELVKRVDPQAVRLPPGLKAIAAEIEAVEREACAKACEYFKVPDKILGAHPDYLEGKMMAFAQAAAAIRARSNAQLPGGREAM